MPGASTWLEQSVFNHFFRQSAVTAPTGLWVALFTVQPDDDGTGGTEVVGGSYARADVSGDMTAPNDSGYISNNVAIEFPDMPDLTSTPVLGVGLLTASVAGNFMGGNLLSTPRTVAAGKTFRIKIGDLTVRIARRV